VKVLGHLGRLKQSREEAAHCEPDDTRMGGRSRIALLNVTKRRRPRALWASDYSAVCCIVCVLCAESPVGHCQLQRRRDV